MFEGRLDGGHELVTVVIMKALVGSWDWGSEGDGFIRTLGRDGAGVGVSRHLGHQDGVAGVRGDEDALKVFLDQLGRPSPD